MYTCIYIYITKKKKFQAERRGLFPKECSRMKRDVTGSHDWANGVGSSWIRESKIFFAVERVDDISSIQCMRSMNIPNPPFVRW